MSAKRACLCFYFLLYFFVKKAKQCFFLQMRLIEESKIQNPQARTPSLLLAALSIFKFLIFVSLRHSDTTRRSEHEEIL